ncbi:cytochrome c2 [Rubricella aquisinus]|uniref:Cytochrome c2 n=1 Tax=Rubricella aquisinus TaxID=2028108 RepID=A0A840WMD3_9RHOB|nr:cytochrome c family protein [Rubricella aquisinus]MBB5515273.1 cytochrome c2 [Rubricella aquisinus]
MDALEFNKIAAGVLGSFLAFMLFGWAGDIIYGTGEAGHKDHHEQAFVIELPDADTAVAEVAEEAPSIAEILLAANAADGETLWRQCAACHKLEDGANGVGPHLYDVIGRPKGAIEEYAYSDAMANFGGEWTPEAMYLFLENPKGYMPGTKMGYNGMRRSEDRGNMIAYLASVSGTDLAPYITEAVAEEAPQAASDAAAPVSDAPATAEEAVEAVEEEANAIVEEATTAVAEAAEAVTEEATEMADAATAAVESAAADVTAALTVVQEEATEQVASATEAAEEATAAATETAQDATAAATEAVAEATEAVALPAFMASADAAAGEQVYRQCRACHVADAPTNRVGPHLVDIVGREKASVDGFRYSDALTSLEGNWGYEELNGFLENPREYAPGTRMTYNGLRSEQDRANVIAYLESLSQ